MLILNVSAYSQSIDSSFIKDKKIPKYFIITGLSLNNNTIYESVRKVFLNPRNYLKEVPEEEWKSSEIYLRYFETYDKNSRYREKSDDNSDTDDFGIEDQVDAKRRNRTAEYIEQNYEDFPLPETIDLEVNIKDWSLKMLEIEFDINKLDSQFRKLLLDFGKNPKYNNQRSIIPKSD